MNIRLHYFEGKRSDTSQNQWDSVRFRTLMPAIERLGPVSTPTSPPGQEAVAMKQWMLFILAIASLSMGDLAQLA
jgi:hypothetical protein